MSAEVQVAVVLAVYFWVLPPTMVLPLPKSQITCGAFPLLVNVIVAGAQPAVAVALVFPRYRLCSNQVF